LVFAIGDALYLREVADTLDKQDDILASIYARHSGGSKAHFRELMDAESWFNDAETVTEGLADEVVDPPRKTKSGDDDPEASHPRRFSEHASEVVAAAEQLLERAEKVIAFRTDQGKPPLSEDSVELLEGLRARLDEVLTSEQPPEDEEQTVDDDLILRSFANLQGD
jgi:hypothetical protein